MIICKGDWNNWEKTSDEDWDKVMDGFGTWVGGLKEKNQYTRGDQLSVKFKSVSRSNEKVTISDGPFTETKESLTGFFLIHADSLEHAAELSKEHPGLFHDRLEIYEIPRKG